jgi:outer membrane protein TolC
MKRLIILIFICVVSFDATAQINGGGAHPVALTEALRLALDNSAQIKKSELEREGTKQRIRLERGMSFPQVDAGISYDYFPVLETQFFSGEGFGQAGEYMPVQIGQPWQLNAGVKVEQVLYHETGRRAMPAIAVTRNLYDLLIEKSEEEVLFQTASLFYQTLQTQQLLRAVNANIEKLVALERIVELQLQNGFAIPTDVKRVQVAKTNLETTRQQLLSGITALQQSLQFMCGVPFDQPFQPVASLESPAADSARWKNLQFTMEATTDYKLIEKQIELYHIQWKSQRAEGWPTLSAHASAFYRAQRADFNVLDPNTQWYAMATVGVKVKVPVFDGFRRHRKADLLRLEEQKLQTDRKQLMGYKQLEYRQAVVELENTLRQLRTQDQNVSLAREIEDNLTLQYKEGVTPLSDVLNAQTMLSEAETNYWQQVFAYKIAVLKLLKAAGQLEELYNL